MKPVGRLSKLMPYAAVLVGGMLALSSDAAMLVNKAVVRAARGNAAFRVGKGDFKPVKVGMIFSPHTAIRTAPGSSVDLFLNENGPVVRVAEDTELSIDKLDLEKGGVEDIIETQLDLRSGRVLGNVRKMAAASKYEVKTPHGVAGIRGTEYDIRADGTVHVITGTVVVVYVDIQKNTTQTVTVNAGQTATPPVGPGAQATVTSVIPGGVTQEANDVRQVTVNYTTTAAPPVPQGSPNPNSNPTTGGGAPPIGGGPNNIAGNVPTVFLHNTPELEIPKVTLTPILP